MKKTYSRVGLSMFMVGLITVMGLSIESPSDGPAAASAAGKKITIAVVRDGPAEMNEILDQIRPELDHLVGSDFDLSFDTSDKYDAGWDQQNMRGIIETALADRTVDMILGIGVLVTYEAARPDFRLTKPFVSATLLDGDIPGLDFDDDRTLKDNLCIVVQPQRTDSEVQTIKRLRKSNRIHLVLSREIFEGVTDLKPRLETYRQEIGVEIVPVPVSTDWKPALDQIGPDAEMVYIVSLPRLPRSQRAAFVEALNDLKIPTFSGVGPQDLEIGMLATNKPDMRQTLVRRVSLNIFQLLTGYSTDDLPVLLISDLKFTINGRTAAKIQFGLSFEAMVLGTVLHPEALEQDADSLNMGNVLVLAKRGNVGLSISNQEVNTALRGKQVVRSPLLPQLDASASYQNFDNNLVGTLTPERWVRGGLNLSQMIFDDELISNFRSAGRGYDAATYQNDSDRLDVYLNAELVYLGYVQMRLMYGIALKNLRLTEGNLEIAKMRVEVGHSGRDEVFRWTAELNQQRTLVMDIESATETTRIELNRILGVDLGKRWRPEALDESSDWIMSSQEKFGFALESQANFDRFTDGAVDLALENSPERKFLQMNLEAEGIQLGQRKRSFIVPKIFLDLNYNYNGWQSPDVPELGDHFYEFRVTAALPLFEGTRRFYDMNLRKSLIVELERRLILADQFVEQRTRNSLRQLQASLPNIEFSRIAAENARKNFEVVRDKYANGIVTITDLLSAQTASFAADQDALVSLYTYLQDSADFQRALSFFVVTKSQSELEEFANTLRQRMDAQEE